MEKITPLVTVKFVGKWSGVLCSSNFSVASGGLYDIKRHSETSLHKKAVTATNKTLALINKLSFRVLYKLAINRRVNDKFVYNECVFIYHFTSLLYYHSTTKYNCVHLNVTHKISPLEELVGGRSPPPSSSQRLTGMVIGTNYIGTKGYKSNYHKIMTTRYSRKLAESDKKHQQYNPVQPIQ